MLTMLREAWSGPAVLGFAAAGAPLAPEAIAALRAEGAERVIVASYLLAPGFFQERLRAARGPLGGRQHPPSVSDRDQAVRRAGHAPVHRQPPESGKMDSC